MSSCSELAHVGRVVAHVLFVEGWWKKPRHFSCGVLDPVNGGGRIEFLADANQHWTRRIFAMGAMAGRAAAALYSGFTVRRRRDEPERDRQCGSAGRPSRHVTDERWVTTFSKAGA